MTENDPVPNDEITDRQLLALPFIAAAPTQTEGAEAAAISVATLARWPYCKRAPRKR